MNALLDTNALIWLALDDKRILSAQKILTSTENRFYISIISFWEIVIKFRIGKIDVDIVDLRKETLKSGFKELTLSNKYLDTLLSLPMYHKDPFDHMIIAQAKYENMTIITGDKIFKEYLPDTIVI